MTNVLRLRERQCIAMAAPCQRATRTVEPEFWREARVRDRLWIRSGLTVNR